MTDPSWRQTATPEAIRARAVLLGDIRAFFSQRRVLEVETPVLSRAGNSDPNLSPFQTGDGNFWLRTSPEYAMKRLLTAGSGDIYELGRVFRSGESGHRHNPEFTMLEWYRVGWDYHRLMDECVELVRSCGHGFFDDWPLSRYSYRDLFLQYADLDPFSVSEAELAKAGASLGMDEHALDRDGWLDLLFSDIVNRRLPAESLVLVCDFPASQAALSRIRPGDPPVAERFELILDRQELANGYQELTDAAEQRQRFEHENRQRASRGETTSPLDENLLAALADGMPDCAGVALGVDRLLMSMLGASRIDEVIAFPATRA